jgi:hypothetical protein
LSPRIWSRSPRTFTEPEPPRKTSTRTGQPCGGFTRTLPLPPSKRSSMLLQGRLTSTDPEPESIRAV